MKRIFFALAAVLILAGCDSSFKCTKGDETIKYVYNNEELVSVQRNGEIIGAIELAVVKGTYDLGGSEDFQENITKINEALGYTCN